MFFKKFLDSELLFTLDKLCYYGRNYGTMENKLWDYTDKYGTLIY